MKFTFDKIIHKKNELKIVFTGSGIFSSKEFTKEELERFYTSVSYTHLRAHETN